jgi:hypothetical protein
MNVAQHAEQILAAWKRADPTSFEEELNDAMRSCQRAEPANYFESEQREVLVSVVERLRLIRPQRNGAQRAAEDCCTPQSLHAGFSLLEHLRQRAAA